VITTASWEAIERTVSLNEYPSTKHNGGSRNTYQRDLAIEEMGGNPSIFSASRIIFSAAWMITSGSAQAQAEEVAGDAVLDRLAPISVAQFMEDQNRESRLKELKALDSWNRADFVKAQGRARMPGEKESDSRVAVECARRLGDL
jgi:hypothetical protein